MKQFGIGYAVLAAALYAVSIPAAKLFLTDISPLMLSALLYFGSGVGMAVFGIFLKFIRKEPDGEPITKSDLPCILGMIFLNTLALACLILGLTMSPASHVSLLNNLEITATALFAMLFFREKVSKRLWGAIGLVTVAGILLSIESGETFSFSTGSLLVILACVFWGLENNCTRVLSTKNPLKISVIKGVFAGIAGLILALCAGEWFPDGSVLPAVFLLGFAAYGLSIFFYIIAQRYLGAAKTSAYYAVSPFIASGMSLIIFREIPTLQFLAALAMMGLGIYFASTNSAEEKNC